MQQNAADGSTKSADGILSAEHRRAVLEHEDLAAVTLFNADTKSVVLVKRFKAPTLNRALAGVGIPEALVGTVRRDEAPDAAAVRIAKQTTNYDVKDVKPVAKFFASPGESLQCVHLYYAKVAGERKPQKRARKRDDAERVQVLEIPLDELLQMKQTQRIEDPKLLIGILWLVEELRVEASAPLSFASVAYALCKDAESNGDDAKPKEPERFIGYKTGSIDGVRDTSVWVNSENEDMIMDRFIGRSISASIRYLGAGKDTAGNLTEDGINNELTAEIGMRSPVRIGTVVETGPGMLRATHGVRRLFHVATVRGAGAGRGVKADIDDLGRCTANVLAKADQRNKDYGWLKPLFSIKNCESILIPMIGAGDGGLDVEKIVPELFGAAVTYYQKNPKTTLREIYFLAYNAGHKAACERALVALRGQIEPRPRTEKKLHRPARKTWWAWLVKTISAAIRKAASG